MAPAPAAITPSEPAGNAPKLDTPARYQRAPDTQGGRLLAGVQLLNGLVMGAAVGASLPSGSSQTAFLTSVSAGLLLGAATWGLSALAPFSMAKAGVLSLGLATGLLAGLGSSLVAGGDGLTTAGLGLGVSQAGLLVAALVLSGRNDVSVESLSLMTAGSLYAATIGLLTMTMLGGVSSTSLGVVLLAPAAGLAISAIVSHWLTLDPRRLALMTGIPIGTAALVALLGSVLGAGQLSSGVALGAMALTLTVTALVTAPDAKPPSTEPAVHALTPSVTVVPAGQHNEGLAVGPAMALQF